MPSKKPEAFPSARVGDGVAGGVIIQGEETVLVGGKAKPVACKECKAKQLKGNPVNTSTGAKVLPGESDFALPAPMAFEMSRFYASDTPFTGLLGQGWRTPIELYCDADDDRTRLVDLQGRWIDFAPLLAGEEQYSPSEGLWIARGTLDQTIAWDERWQWLPMPYRHDPNYLIATPGAGNYLVFMGVAKPEPTKSNPAPQAVGQYDLIAAVDRYGYTTSVAWHTLHNAAGRAVRVPEFITDSAGRIYRMHTTMLPDENKRHWSSGHPDTDAGIRLSGISLAYDPLRDGGTAPDLSWLRDQRVTEWLVRYQYSEAGDLVEVQDGDGDWTRRFEYRQHLMTRHQTPGGTADTAATDVRYEYDRDDVDGKVTRQIQAGGLTYDFVYHPKETCVTDSLGRITRYQFEGEAGLKRLVQKTDPDGAVVKMAYTSDGQMSRHIDPLGRKTHFRHSSLGEYLGSIDPLGHREQSFVDPATGLVSSTRDAEGQIVRYQRDARGNVTEIMAPDGSKTRFQYDHPDFPDRPSAIIDARGGKKIPTYDTLGQLSAFTDCSGQTTRYQRDRKGRLQAIETADGKRQTYQRDRKGRVTAAILPDGSRERFEYDYAGRLTKAVDVEGRPIEMRYDPQGRVVEHRVWIADKNASVVAHSLGWRITHIQYDTAGRLAKLTNTAGAMMAFGYDSMDRLIEEIGFDGKRSGYRYNLAGELVSLTEGQGSADTVEIRHEYDAGGRLIARHIPERNGCPEQVHRFTYNKRNQLVCASTYNTTVDFAYDVLGQLIAETQATADGHSQTLRYGYDLLGNRNRLILPDGQRLDTLMYGSGHWHQIAFNGQPLVDVERDSLHREISRTYGSGSRHPVAHPLLRTQHYTTLGQLDSVALTRGGRVLDQRCHHYDGKGMLTRIDRETHTLHDIVRYAYDGQERLIGWDVHDVIAHLPSAGNSAGKPSFKQAHAAAWAHDPAGNPIALGATRRIDPVSGVAVYATVEQWETQVRANLDNPAFNMLGQNIPRPNRTAEYGGVQCNYDERGNVTRRQTEEGVWEFAWNALNQLTVCRFTPTGATEPAYMTSYYYDAFSRRVAKLLLDLRNLRYDAAGEVEEDSLPQILTRYLWNGERMLQEIHATHAKTIVYEPHGFVPVAQILGPRQRSGPELSVEEQEAQRTEQRNLTLFFNNPTVPQEAKQALLAQLDDTADQANTRIYLLITDHLGTPYRMIDARTHEAMWEREQDPWGNTLKEWCSPELKDEDKPNLRFQGQQWEWETGLHYNRYRYYDPKMHRYLSQDPIGVMGGHNFYAYPLNPTAFVDPLGLMEITAKKLPSGDNKGEYRFSFDFSCGKDCVEIEAGIDDFATGKYLKWIKRGKKWGDKISSSAGQSDIKDVKDRAECAKYNKQLEKEFEANGYKTGKFGGTDLTEEQARKFLRESGQSLPADIKQKYNWNNLIDVAKDRALPSASEILDIFK